MTFGTPLWGIFDSNGFPVLEGDSVMGVEIVHDNKISDAPQERGAFMSYNKVAVPYQARLTYLVTGSEQRRGAFIATCERLLASLDFVTVVMPEFQYMSANVTHYGFQRLARAGAQLLRVEVWCQEVRVVGTAEIGEDTKSINGAGNRENGTVSSSVMTNSEAIVAHEDNLTAAAHVPSDKTVPSWDQINDAQRNAVVKTKPSGSSSMSVTFPSIEGDPAPVVYDP